MISELWPHQVGMGMRLNREQIKADHDRMKRYTAERIPDDGTRVGLGGGSWADLH
jgi:hypothetical protein